MHRHDAWKISMFHVKLSELPTPDNSDASHTIRKWGDSVFRVNTRSPCHTSRQATRKYHKRWSDDVSSHTLEPPRTELLEGRQKLRFRLLPTQVPALPISLIQALITMMRMRRTFETEMFLLQLQQSHQHLLCWIFLAQARESRQMVTHSAWLTPPMIQTMTIKLPYLSLAISQTAFCESFDHHQLIIKSTTTNVIIFSFKWMRVQVQALNSAIISHRQGIIHTIITITIIIIIMRMGEENIESRKKSTKLKTMPRQIIPIHFCRVHRLRAAALKKKAIQIITVRSEKSIIAALLTMRHQHPGMAF